jgi:Short C-terminal domain
VLFLYRPRETWMPYRVPRNMTQQRAYNREMQQKFDETRQHAQPPSTASPTPSDPISALKDLAQLHDSGALTDAEFTAAKAKLLDADDET